MKNEATGLRRIVKATGYSWQGFVSAYRHEEAFRQEVWIAIVLIPLAFFVADSALEWSLLTGSVVLLLIVELLNSGIEAVVDRVGEEWNELAGRAKDLGSAAVLLAIFLLVAVWAALLIY